MEKYHNENKEVFIYLLCLKSNIQESEIAVLRYEEYKQIKNKAALTIGVEKGKKTFFLFTGESKARSNALLLKRNRNDYRFSKLLKDELSPNGLVKIEKMQYKTTNVKASFERSNISCYEDSAVCPICEKGDLHLAKSRDAKHHFICKKCSECGAVFLQKKDYMKIAKEYGGIPLKNNVSIMNWHQEGYEGYYVEEVDKVEKEKSVAIVDVPNLIYTLPYDGNQCPIHHKKMNISVIDFGKHIKDTVYYCDRCNKMYIDKSRKSYLEVLLKGKRIVSRYKLV